MGPYVGVGLMTNRGWLMTHLLGMIFISNNFLGFVANLWHTSLCTYVAIHTSANSDGIFLQVDEFQRKSTTIFK